MLKILFYWRGRINRPVFFFYTMGALFVFFGIAAFFYNNMLSYTETGKPIATPLLIVWWLVYWWITLMLNIKRGHDYNLPGVVTFFLAIFFVPVLNIVNLIIPGSKSANRYGDVPDGPKEPV